ncbi:retrovirus-related Pol polyprotein from transposon 17.6 [Trichonephila clavipes]|nr:retrovirus-related Pol polyprotein from transposon 17.6 [Trichonephila clavipes]
MNYYNANNEDNINVKNNKGLDQISDSPEADLKRLFNPAMVVEDTIPRQTSEQWGDLTQLLDKFQTIFSQNKYDVGCINLEPQRIHLISDLPISLRPYRNSQQESKEIQTQIEELLKAGFIRPSHSPYAAPVTLAYKKDEGKRSRLCIDYRKLNEITRKDSTPVPLIDFVIDNLTHAKFFSTLDLTSGYWHIKIHEKDAEKLAFTTNFGFYEWLRLPFGWKNSPAVFQRTIRQILQKYQLTFALNYFDDIIIFSQSWEEHLTHLDTIFQICKKENIKLKKSKSNRPQCNGKNERVNQTLVAKLRCKVNSTTKTPWTKLLEQVTYEYNNSPHDVTGFPPAYLMFGTLPYDSPLPNQVKLNYPPIQQARQIAVNRTIKHHKINKQRYDRHYVDAKFKVGDLVLYQNFSYPNSSKLQSPYNGPFKVVRKLSNVTYEIDKPNQYTGKLTDIVHSTRLKPFHSKSNFQLC